MQDLTPSWVEMRASLIYNPASGRGVSKAKRLHLLLERLKRQGIDAMPMPTSAPGHAAALAREAVKQGMELVLAWGGDGTLNEVVCGMQASAVPVGVLPGGSVNVFARAAGIPLELGEACDALTRAKARLIPVGTVGERPFLLMAGIGLDAEVVRRLGKGAKRLLGSLAFWIKGLALLATYSYPSFTVRAAGRVYPATSAIAGRVRYYGGNYIITPDARLEEPRLDVVLFQGRGPAAYLRYLAGVLGDSHLRFRDVVHFQATRVDVEATALVYYQLDGEVAGTTPLSVGVHPHGVCMLLPS